MDTLSYKTVSANKATVQKEWNVVDAKDEVLGRLASKVAMVLRGKHKPSFTPHVDCGDYVIVINAEKVKLTGKKLTEKQYLRQSGYPGGQRTQTPEDLLSKKPEAVGNKIFQYNRPGQEKDDFNIEEDKQHRHQIIAHRHPASSRTIWVHTRLIRHHLGLDKAFRTKQMT